MGNIEDFELFSEEKLKRDFGEYGDIELVNFLKEKYVSALLRDLVIQSGLQPCPAGTVHSSTSPTSLMPSKQLTV